jgi:FkbM family methyltransferase
MPIEADRPYTKRHRWRGLELRALRRLRAGRPLRYTLASGDTFMLHPGDKLSELIYTGRGYEPLESAWCRRFLQPGDAAYDVGANIGYFTAMFSRCVGPRGRVVAFEPGEHTYRLLRQTIERLALANVVSLPVALWDRSEVLSLHSSRAGHDAQQSLAQRDKHGSDTVLLPVPAVSFGDLIASRWFQSEPAPALIKIDVEGAEPQVLEGMADALDARAWPTPALLIECNSEALRALGSDPAALLLRLGRWYELHATALCWPPWHAAHDRLTPLDAARVERADLELNIVAVPREGPLRERALRALD